MSQAALLVIVVALASTVNSSPGPRESLENRIVGGEIVSIEDYPFQTSLFFQQSFRCGGVIISDVFVLSAAHCVG